MAMQQTVSNGAALNGYPSEAELIGGLRARKEAAFESLVRAYAGRLYATALRLLRHEQDAADAVQEAFLHAFRTIDRFRGDSRLLTWLNRIAINAALMKLRDRRRRRSERSIDALLPRFAPDGHRIELSDPWQETADELLSRRDVREKVRLAIDRLPDEYRTILLLRDVEGLDTEQAARFLSVSRGAVKVRLHRARMALRELLEAELSP